MRSVGVLAVCALGIVAGCYLGGTPLTEQQAAEVGPAPLRRLTSSEYLNSLHDLFPNLALTLPPLPADAIIGGFDNAASAQAPSDVAIARYETIANLYAAAATVDDAAVTALVGCDWSTSDLATSCSTKFINEQGRRIFRRPLTSDEFARLQTKFVGWQSAVDFEAAVELTLATMLQAPQFIYRPEPLVSDEDPSTLVAVDAYELATRLSFFLWSSTPDDALLDAAESGALIGEDGVRTQATRMLQDGRARRTLWDFHRQWLALDLVVTTGQTYRTPDIDPNWSAQTATSSETETELFVENTLMSGGTLHDLLLSPHAWVDGEMSRVYKLPSPSDPTTFNAVDLPPDQRGGLLTRVAFLAGTSHAGGTSPPIRGNAVQLRLLCELPISPPPNADTSMPTAPPGSGPQTTRIALRTANIARDLPRLPRELERNRFRFRKLRRGRRISHDRKSVLPIDASGVLMGTDVDGPFDGALDLSAKLDRSTVVHRCATQSNGCVTRSGAHRWTRSFLLVDAWTSAFQSSVAATCARFSWNIVTSPTFRYRRAGNQ